ncbi:MAG: hypothetical protein IKB90_03790 [Alistipes sp.]|nr:hypothetical protein [Alistipes sp.]
MKRFLQLICCATLLTACEQWGESLDIKSNSAIAFNAESFVRSAVTQEDIDNARATVKVYATRNGNVLYNNVEIGRENTGKWYPKTGKTDWVSGSNYLFYGYAYNTTEGLTINDNGKLITVNQPTSYNEEMMIDYLLSYQFSVANGAMKPIVQLQLEHAMALVEIYVVRGNLFDARLKKLSLENLYSSASLKCTTHATINEGITNEWEVTLSGNGSTKYTVQSNPGMEIGDTRENTAANMKLMCIPQQLTANTTLNIVYEVNEKVTSDGADNWVEHTETFHLYKYDPIAYQSGHRIVYTATIDSGVNLQGVIAEWKDVDYIEGTILPEIPSGDDENEN